MVRHKNNGCQVDKCKNGCWRDVCNSCSKRIRCGELPEQLGVRHNPPCEIKGCEEPRYTMKAVHCRGHYNHKLEGKDPNKKRSKRRNHSTVPACSEGGCVLAAQAKGKCAQHRRNELKPPKMHECSVEGCGNRTAVERCARHSKQYESFGIAWVDKRPSETIRELRIARYGDCGIPDCDRKETSLGSGLCQKHWGDRWRKNCSPEFYLELMSRTSCESCGETTKLVVDHDHSCHPGDRMCESCIRGRLCNGCNTALGYVGESAQKLRQLANYIERFS